MWLKELKKGYDKLTKEKARIIAHLIGDGAHYKNGTNYTMKLEVKDEESLKQFESDLIEVYGLNPTWWTNPSGITGEPIKFVVLLSKLAFEDLSRYATYFSKDWKINQPILDAPLKIKREFLKALFDDEGSVRNKWAVTLYSINENGLLQVKKMLMEFGIESRMDSRFGCMRNVYGLTIKDLKLFNNKIGFNLERKQEKLESFI